MNETFDKGEPVRIKGKRGSKALGKVASPVEEDSPHVTVIINGQFHTFPKFLVERQTIKVYTGGGRRRTKIVEA